MRGRSRPLAVIAVFTLVGLGVLFCGCSDNDNVAAPSQPTLTGTPLNASTSEAAAGVSANTVELTSNIGVILARIATKFIPQPLNPAGPSPLGPIPLPGGSGLCTLGATLDNVVLNDNDSSGGPSAGDTITVTLQNCIVEPGVSLSGTPAILFTLTDNGSLEPPITFKGTLALNFTVTDSIGTSNIVGTMAAEAVSSPNSAVITLGADNGTSTNTQITLSESGTSLSFGCFYVTLAIEQISWSPTGYFSMWTRGITKMSSGIQNQIMQLGDYADPLPKEHLDFNPINGGWEPFQGTLKLLEFDSRGDHGLQQCYGGPTTGTTSELVRSERHEQYDIVLDTFKNTNWSGTPDNTIFTNWGTLLDI